MKTKQTKRYNINIAFNDLILTVSAQNEDEAKAKAWKQFQSKSFAQENFKDGAYIADVERELK